MTKITHEDFIENEFYHKYVELIEYRRNNPIFKKKGEYSERHHIIPDALGGSDEKENIVRLLGREHFTAHLYLPKFTKGKSKRSMLEAFHLLRIIPKHKNHDLDKDASLLYEELKIERSKSMSKRMKEIHANDPERAKRASKLRKEMNEDPAHIERLIESWKDEERLEAQSKRSSEMMKEKYKDPAFKELQAERNRARNKDPEMLKHNAETTKQQWQDPVFREKQRNGVRKAKSVPVEITFEDGTVIVYSSFKEASNKTGCGVDAIKRSSESGSSRLEFGIVSVRRLKEKN